jgi:hypothetical protein
MNKGMRGTRISGLIAAMAFPLLLAGCFAPHVVNSEDTRYCESQGFRPGSDPNYQCARDREAARDRGEIPALAPTPAPKPLLSAQAAPDHVGGVSQITPRSIPPETTRIINFSIAVNSDCEVIGEPKVRIGMQPTHGTLRLIRLTDFARLAQSGAPVSCGDKRVPGLALLYTPKTKSYEGEDLLDLEVVTPAGRTYFKVPITIENPDESDE